MKKLLMLLLAVVTFVFSGCKKDLPTPEKFETIAESIGVATGYVVNQTKIDGKARNALIDVMNAVRQVTPNQNQTFTDAWTPIAKQVVDKLVADGSLDKDSAELVTATFGVVCKGIDYIFNVRYPKAKTQVELVNAAIRGFIDGFLTVFKPINNSFAATPPANMDKEAYKYLTK